jgi:hypothetical protein
MRVDPGRRDTRVAAAPATPEPSMHNIIYIIGLIVVIAAVLSFVGLA